MINLGSTKCECGKTANYGVVGGRRTHCAEHKTEGMTDKRTGKSNPGVVPRRTPSPEVVPSLAPKPVVAGTVVEKATAAFVEARAAAVDFVTRSGEREVVDAGTSAPSGRTLGEPTPTAGVFVPSTTLSRAAGADVPGEDQGASTAVGAQEEGTWSPASTASPAVSPAPARPSECDGGGEEMVARHQAFHEDFAPFMARDFGVEFGISVIVGCTEGSVVHIIPKTYGGYRANEIEAMIEAGKVEAVELKRGEALVMGPGLIHRGVGYNTRNSRLFVAFLAGASKVASFLNTYSVLSMETVNGGGGVNSHW
ncbi:unnamed protein product [Ectocarpus fasciculatus]